MNMVQLQARQVALAKLWNGCSAALRELEPLTTDDQADQRRKRMVLDCLESLQVRVEQWYLHPCKPSDVPDATVDGKR